uniref:Uncharacterized protein n=1 Tax=Dunaliella tertiolecta TaxID=3047 RepID=A0A7S3QXW1_DUNTE
MYEKHSFKIPPDSAHVYCGHTPSHPALEAMAISDNNDFEGLAIEGLNFLPFAAIMLKSWPLQVPSVNIIYIQQIVHEHACLIIMSRCTTYIPLRRLDLECSKTVHF